MLTVTKISYKATTNRLVFIASAPDTSLGIPGALRDVIGTVPLDSSVVAADIAPTLTPANYQLVDVEGDFGSVRLK